MKRLIPIPLVLLCAVAAGEPEWQLVKSENKVLVYTRLEAGNTYKSVKAVGLANATSQQVLNLLNDTSTYQNWFAFAKNIKLLNATENTKHVYVETNLPWPLRNLDMIYEIIYTERNDGSV